MKKIFCSLLLFGILYGCQNEKPLIVNADRLKDVEKMLNIQKELTANSQIPIWSILDLAVSKKEEQALKFLYAYMPLSDLADYSPQFMLANVRQSLLAKEEMTWGRTIPEEEFLHFVLPPRVNNENLDSFRLAYYPEIKARINGLSMKEAALEINHWCHEKVNYRGTDSRTSAPMSTISKTFGRCGEESTFTVASMRTAGIPARQVYTPRWAHTDDNHAWVEVWIDGKWHFMGACEPDTDLDRGWFSEPSQRTMLIHTRTYGRYFGTEEVLDAEERFSELNLTANYAVTKKVTIVVNNSDGTPVEGAKVEFKLYNYAEFYPLATLPTDRQGVTSFTTGLGDLLIWASKGGNYDFKKLHVATTDTLTLIIDQNGLGNDTESLDLVPPKTSRNISSASDVEKKINDKRLAQEDSIRNRYMATFKDSAWVRSFAKDHQLSADTLLRIYRLSYGNWKEMSTYFKNPHAANSHLLLSLICNVSDKDLSDTKSSVLDDHLTGILAMGNPTSKETELFDKYVLSPRIDLEILSPWRNYLRKSLGIEMAEATQKDMAILTNWIKTNIRMDEVANKHSRAPLTPIGVYNLRVADPLSRDIFFVAACRTFGIPARLNPETRTPEYNLSGVWSRAGFGDVIAIPEMGKLQLKNDGKGVMPQYSLHFTIARITDGKCKTVEFDEGKKVTDFPDPLILETGKYILVTGKRLTDGTVLNSINSFEINKGQSTTLNVNLRQEATTLKPVGRIDPAKINLMESGKDKVALLSLLMKNSGAVIVLLDPDSEPSKHILNDLGPYINQFDNWNGHFIFVNTSEKGTKADVFKNYKLPEKTCLTVDSSNELEAVLTSLTGKEAKNNLPIVVFCQPSGEVLMITTGYRIGIGEALSQTIKDSESNTSNGISKSCTTP
jgi:hypothetical protein